MRRWMGRHASPLMRRFPRMKPLLAVLSRVRTGAFAAAAAAAELFSVRELVLWGFAGLFWLRPTCAAAPYNGAEGGWKKTIIVFFADIRFRRAADRLTRQRQAAVLRRRTLFWGGHKRRFKTEMAGFRAVKDPKGRFEFAIAVFALIIIVYIFAPNLTFSHAATLLEAQRPPHCSSRTWESACCRADPLRANGRP